MCAKKVHATRHCDNEGYDIRSLNMVVVLQDFEESSCTSGSYDEEIILEGPDADQSRIFRVVQKQDDETAPCMRIKREISSFASTAELTGADHSDLKEGTKSERENENYSALDEDFFESEGNLETLENTSNSRAQKLIWRDGREFQVQTKLGNKTKNNHKMNRKKKRKPRTRPKRTDNDRETINTEDMDRWEDEPFVVNS